MNLRVIRAVVSTEAADETHQARLLLLLSAAGSRGDGSVGGITKLAKIDFLVRYPGYFERLLRDTRKRVPTVIMRDFERDTVESRMIRFRYGPWDPRYRRWLGLLVARGLVKTWLKGRTVNVAITPAGERVGAAIAEQPEFNDLSQRCEQVVASVGSWSGTKLKDQVYASVPELVGKAWGEAI